MRKTLILAACLALVAGAGVAFWSNAEVATSTDSNELKIAALVTRLDTMGAEGVNALEPLEVRRFEVPGPSVDVMRARLIETYTIEGIGSDSVELTGWIAVKHFNARPVDGSETLTWNNAVVDTQFVGMDLRGESELFGPVVVKLDATRPVQGQVGRIQIPELAETVLIAQARGDSTLTAGSDSGNKGWGADAAGWGGDDPECPTAPRSELEPALTASPDRGEYGDMIESDGGSGATGIGDSGAFQQTACAAPVNVAAFMPELGLEMKLAKPAIWYSRVDTIPPVGTTASVTIEPVDLIADGRVVGQLNSGKVCFREVVSRTELENTIDHQTDRIAQH